MYSFWFAFGLLALAFYGRHRGVVQFGRWDLLCWVPFLIVTDLIFEFVGDTTMAAIVVDIMMQVCTSMQTKIIGERADKA